MVLGGSGPMDCIVVRCRVVEGGLGWCAVLV